MCNFMSAIVLPTGEVITDPEHTDSHEDLIRSAGLRDDRAGNFVRVEFTPPNDESDWCREDMWSLTLDEPEAPAWWAEKEGSTRRFLEGRVRRMLDPPAFVLGGCWIAAGRDVVAKGARVIAQYDSNVVAWDGSNVVARDCSHVEALSGSRVTAQDGSYVEAMSGSHVDARDGSHVVARYGSHVVAQYGSHVDARDGSSVSRK